jgi:hypothetical protein
MALKNLSVLDSNVGSYATETQPDRHPALRAQIYNDALFEPGGPFLDEAPLRRFQPETFSDDDYDIALVRRTGTGQGSMIQPSPTIDRVFLLPLTWRELVDRVRTELSHSNSVEPSMKRFGEVAVNLLTMEISRSEKPVVLTPKEFKLLRFLIKTPEQVFSRSELLNEVWGYNNYPSTRTVDNHVCMLRQKLEPIPARPIHFLTVRGMGYKFVP